MVAMFYTNEQDCQIQIEFFSFYSFWCSVNIIFGAKKSTFSFKRVFLKFVCSNDPFFNKEI